MPDDMPRLAAAALAAAGIVLFGAGYAALLALGRVRRRVALRRAALGAYGGVVLAAAGLCWALRLQGLWLVLVLVLLIGYFAAPRAIWWLSVATHQGEADDDAPSGAHAGLLGAGRKLDSSGLDSSGKVHATHGS